MNGNRCTSDNMRDLDHMFDNSDDLSSDEAVAAVSIFWVILKILNNNHLILCTVANANTSWFKQTG